MSDPLRIALVAEGPTDRIVVEAALRAMLPPRSFVLTLLQPEGSTVFGELGTGWVGVYRWCHQAAARGRGRLAQDLLVFGSFDLLVIHLDADVAGKRYAEGSLQQVATDGRLPCEAPCPPASATTSALREVLLTWCGETAVPTRTIVCMPSKNTEAWVLTAVFPYRSALLAWEDVECLPNPEARLAQLPKALRVRKNLREYQAHKDALERAWPELASAFGEAGRFQADLTLALDEI